MWLGYTTSLAGAQCLFFAFLLLHPRQHKSAARLATWPVLSFAMVEGVLIVLVSLALRWDERSRRSWPSGTYIFFSVIQGLLIAIPLIAINSAALVANAHSKDRAGWHRLRPKSFWHALSVFSIILHVYSTYVAFAEANGSSWVGKSNGWAGQLNWFVPWRDESHEPIQELRHIGVSIFKALGDHPWINALGWDVLLSAVVLCFWSVLSSTDARDMIRCSLLPALADGASQFEEARSDRGRPSRGAAGRQSSRTGKHAKLRQDAQEPGRSASRGRASSAPHTADGSDEGQWYSALTKFKPWRPLFLANGTPRIPHAGRAEEDQSLWSQHQEAPGEAEAAGLTWCLWVLGGLGTASAAVLGANQHEI